MTTPYHPVARGLHWLMAVFIFGLLVVLMLTGMPISIALGLTVLVFLSRTEEPYRRRDGRMAWRSARSVRIAVLGSGVGSNFKAIVEAIAAGKLDAEVVAAISDQKDSGFLAIAKQAGQIGRAHV